MFFALGGLFYIENAYPDHPEQDRPPWVKPSLWTQCCAGSHCRKATVAFISERKDGLVLVEIDGTVLAIPKEIVHYGREGWVCTVQGDHFPVASRVKCLFVPPRTDT